MKRLYQTEDLPSPLLMRIRREALEPVDAAAQFSLGMCYLTGDCVPKDYAESFKWMRKAAEQGDVASQACLGSAYDIGLGVPKDNVMAYMWYNLVAANGNEHAAKMLDIIGYSMTPEQIAKAQKLSREWKPKKEENNVKP